MRSREQKDQGFSALTRQAGTRISQAIPPSPGQACGRLEAVDAAPAGALMTRFETQTIDFGSHFIDD